MSAQNQITRISYRNSYSCRIPIPVEGVCSTNYIIPVDSSAIFYFAFVGNTGGISIDGNIQQQGYYVVFDNLGLFACYCEVLGILLILLLCLLY